MTNGGCASEIGGIVKVRHERDAREMDTGKFVPEGAR